METNTGTIAVTKNSNAIVGTGTNFDDEWEGKYLKVVGNDVWMIIDTVTDATHLTLTRNYRGETTSGVEYEIGSDTQWTEPDIISEPETDAGKFGDVP